MKKQVKGFKKKTTSLEDLPQIGPMKNKQNSHWWGNYYTSKVKVGNKRSYKHIQRFLRDSIGKDFDTEFSKFCDKFEKFPFFKDQLLEEFNPKYGRYRYDDPERWDRWIVDKQGRIQLIKGTSSLEKDTYTFYSIDYKAEERHKFTGQKFEDLPWNLRMRNKYDKADYEYVVVSGFCKTFTSKEDPEYCKLYYEKEAQLRKREREKKKSKAAQAYSFLTKEELAIKNGQAKNLIDMQRHGFSEDSFHGEEYHGQKRKKKRFKLQDVL